ncbi:MAG: hypothetical protein AABX82_01850 [Nanoarchaeota archaeon]
MKFPKLFIISMFVFATLFLASCTQQAGSETISSVWMGGSDGLVVEFEDFGVGNEIYEDEAFPVVALLQNQGEFTVQAHDVEMKIRGISENDFSGLDFERTNEEKIDKVSEYLPGGGYERVNFGEAVYEGLTGTFYDANIYLEYTYPYATYIAIPKVCFKEDLRDETVCDVSGSVTAFSSASPIQIGSVTEKPYGSGKIYLEIPIYNTGQGRSKAYMGDDFSTIYDTVAFQVETAGMECNSRGDPSVARMARTTVDNAGASETTIVCISDALAQDARYTRQVDLTVTYYYQDLVSTRVRIKENPDLD